MRFNRTSLYAGIGMGFAAVIAALAFQGAAVFSQAPQASRVRSADEVQRDVDAMNASVQRSEQAFEESMRRPGPTDIQIASFQAEADKACVCTDRSGPKAEGTCWANYRAMTKRYRPQQLISSCMFRTTSGDMFPGDKWVSLNRCTADREAAELAKAAGGQPDEC